jgi:hypothetical protein
VEKEEIGRRWASARTADYRTRLPATQASLRPAPFESYSRQSSPLLHTSWGIWFLLICAVGSGFVYLALSKSSSMACTPVAGVVSQMQANDGPVSLVSLC